MASSLLYNLAQLCVIVGILSSSSAFAPSSRNSSSRSTAQRVRMVDRTTTTTTTRLQGTVTPDENQGREALSRRRADSSGGDGAINEELLEISYEIPTKWSQDYMYLNPTKGVT
eukprot:scaffold340225_cov37-Attheya_sp.AAC.1